MKGAVAALTGIAVFVSSPLFVFGQTTQPAQNQPMSPGAIGVIEGTVMNVDTSCAGASSGAADCQAVVEVKPAPTQSSGGGTPGTGTSTTYGGTNAQQTLKITIPKSIRITDQRGEKSASPPHPPGSQLQTGNRVKINYETKPDGGSVATVITILNPPS